MYVFYLHIAAMSHVGNSYIHSAPALYGGVVGETSSNMGCIRVPSLCPCSSCVQARPSETTVICLPLNLFLHSG